MDNDDHTNDSNDDDGSEKSSVLGPLSLAVMESLSVPLVQEVVISADLRCAECQKRIDTVISRFNETDSITVCLSEKKVAITCKYIRGSKTQTTSRLCQSKAALIKWIFRSSRP